MEKLTNIQTILITAEQKRTMKTLKEKYNINTSQFIRDAIFEKLERERKDIIEVQQYLRTRTNYPF